MRQAATPRRASPRMSEGDRATPHEEEDDEEGSRGLRWPRGGGTWSQVHQAWLSLCVTRSHVPPHRLPLTPAGFLCNA
ncbi:unnamed protein product [Lampetra fluviatilis]